MSKNIHNYKDWGSKVFEQQNVEQEKSKPVDTIKFNTTVGGKTLSFIVSINVDKETKKRYPGPVQMHINGSNFIAYKKNGMYTYPKDMQNFIKISGKMNPKSSDEMSMVGAWKKFVELARAKGIEIKTIGNFAKWMNGEYVVAGNLPSHIPVTYSTASKFFPVTSDKYTWKFRTIDYTNVDTKQKTATNLGKQVFVEGNGKKTSYTIKTIYGKSFATIDKSGTSKLLKPKNKEQIAKLETVVDKHTMMMDSFWTDLGAALKHELEKRS